MQLICTKRKRRERIRSAFTLLEVLVAMGIIGVTFIALYGGLTYGMTRVQLSREDLRATQILMEKMETIRLYNWDQITATGTNLYIPTNFTASYSPSGGGTNGGAVYSGEVKIEDSSLGTNYDDDIKKVTVTLNWKTGSISRSRTISTLVAQNGLHSHIYQAHYH